MIDPGFMDYLRGAKKGVKKIVYRCPDCNQKRGEHHHGVPHPKAEKKSGLPIAPALWSGAKVIGSCGPCEEWVCE